MQNKLIVFQSKKIRRTLYNDDWWFSVADVVEALTDSSDPRQYIKKMRQRDLELNSYWGTICTPFALKAPDGKMRKTNCANTEGIFCIIQSIPSPKAGRSSAARKGGKIAAGARKNLEIESGDKVVSAVNYLTEPESRKRLKR